MVWWHVQCLGGRREKGWHILTSVLGRNHTHVVTENKVCLLMRNWLAFFIIRNQVWWTCEDQVQCGLPLTYTSSSMLPKLDLLCHISFAWANQGSEMWLLPIKKIKEMILQCIMLVSKEVQFMHCKKYIGFLLLKGLPLIDFPVWCMLTF